MWPSFVLALHFASVFVFPSVRVIINKDMKLPASFVLWLLKCINELWVFLYVLKVITLLVVIPNEKFEYDFSSWCNLGLKFGKITPGFTLTVQWEAGNYYIIFWSMTSKTEFSSESAFQFLYIFSIYVATTHLATKFYKKIEKV